MPDPDTICYLTVTAWQRTKRTLDKHRVAGEKPVTDLSGCERLTWEEACEKAEALERQGYAITYAIRASITKPLD